MITPLSTPSALDVAGTERQVERLLEGGVHGIFVLGTTGEGPCLSLAIQEEMIRETCRQVAGRVPVLVGVSDASFEQTIQLAWTAAEHGATALTIAPPFYLPLGQTELVTYFQRLAPRLPLPFVAYDIPSMTKTHLEIATVRRLLDLEPCVGIKDSSGQMIYHHELIRLAREREDFCVLIGPEELLPESVMAGSNGGVPGGANIAPGLYVKIYEAARRRDHAALAALREQLFLLREIYFQGSYASSLINGVKTALKLMGVCSNVTAEPFRPLDALHEHQVRHILDALADLVGTTSNHPPDALSSLNTPILNQEASPA